MIVELSILRSQFAKFHMNLCYCFFVNLDGLHKGTVQTKGRQVACNWSFHGGYLAVCNTLSKQYDAEPYILPLCCFYNFLACVLDYISQSSYGVLIFLVSYSFFCSICFGSSLAVLKIFL